MMTIDLNDFVAELDVAEQAHLEWSQRIFRCAVLHATPGDDVVSPEAHTLCRFGRWFMRSRDRFDALDATRAEALDAAHRTMHDAIRSLCLCVKEGRPGLADDLDVFTAAQRALIDHLAYFKTVAMQRATQRDVLTGLPLRHRMESDFDVLTSLARLRDVMLVMMVDLDRFKEINDRYGHAGGDVVLQQVAVTLGRVLRDDDLIYRYGGEEFVLVMRVSAERMAVELAAERVLYAVRELAVTLPDGEIVRPTVTIGVAMAGDGENLAALIDRADRAMYAGKAGGRNCCVVSGERGARDSMSKA